MALDPSKTILIVDDYATMRRILRNVLRKLGYSQFIEADDGVTALEQLKKQKIDMIVCDWNMPKMSGLELLKIVRSSNEYKEIPFIMVTAEAQKKNVIDAVKAGVSNYIVKPFTEEQIAQKLEKVFEHQS